MFAKENLFLLKLWIKTLFLHPDVVSLWHPLSLSATTATSLHPEFLEEAEQELLTISRLWNVSVPIRHDFRVQDQGQWFHMLILPGSLPLSSPHLQHFSHTHSWAEEYRPHGSD